MKVFKSIIVICLCTFVLLNMSFLTYAQKKVNDIQLLSSTKTKSVIQFNIDEYKLKTILINNNEVVTIEAQNTTKLLETGSPDLPKMTTSLIIPDDAEMKVTVVSSEFTELQNINIAPSKGNLLRNVDPKTIQYIYGVTYSQDAFFPEKITTLNSPYISRDYRGQAVNVFPFQYNPVTKILRIYNKIVLEVEQVEGVVSAENVKVRTKEFKVVDHEYAEIYKHHFINYNNLKYTPLEEEGGIVVISYSSFIESMMPYVEWKNQKGIHTTIYDVATIGATAAAIKTFITDQYNTKNIVYVLLVGDVAQIPTNSGSGLGGPSDNAYGFIDGNDHYPELFIGRFSAENVTQVEIQVQKVLDYEKNPSTSTGHFPKSIGIGSDQGPGDDNEYDYQHIRNLQLSMQAYTYTSYYELYDGSQGGFDASGNPGTTLVSSAVNSGAGAIVYCGHGSSTSWGTTGFSNTQVNALTNTGKLPFIWAVACVNGEFNNGTCFAEAWLRANQNGEPTGAVATLMSTINQSWDPPMEGQDEMVALLIESYSSNIKRTFGGLSMNGCMKMNDSYTTGGYSMTDTWNLFGDPSLMVYTTTPTPMVVSHVQTVPMGTTQVSVNCDTDDALVCLSLNGNILGTAYVSAGVANIVFPAVNIVDTIIVTITAYNKLPYFGQIEIVPNVGPFVTLSGFSIDDSNANNNNLADYNELIALNLFVENIGSEPASNVNATITTSDTYVTISDNSEFLGMLDTTGIFSFNSAFKFLVNEFVPDGHVVNFVVSFDDSQANSWQANLSVTINSPDFQLQFVTLDDSNGNNNGIIDGFEEIVLNINALNIGHAIANNAICHLSTENEYVTIQNPDINIGSFGISATVPIAYTLNISPVIPVGTIITFNFLLEDGSYQTILNITKECGIVVENWESGDMTSFNWIPGGNIPWIITSDGFYEGNFAAHSGAIGNSQTSEMSIVIDVLADDTISFYKKVSCEVGYNWSGTYIYYDYLEFMIDGVSMGKWDGEIDWSEEKFPISSGSHMLKWIYSKDESTASGEDRALVDYIVFPALNINYAPVYISEPVTTGYSYSNYIYNVVTYDFNTQDQLTLTCPELPTWLSFSDNGDGTASLSGYPGFSNIGNHNVEISVTDNIAPAVNQSFTIEVVEGISVNQIDKNLNDLTLSPNPANNFTNISFSLHSKSVVTLFISDVIGKTLQNIIQNESLNEGDYKLFVNMSSLNSGIYYVNFEVNGIKNCKLIILTR